MKDEYYVDHDHMVIGFSKPRNNKFPLFSWIIRLIEWTPYSHVYIRWWNHHHDEIMVYEASGTVVKFLGGEAFKYKVDELEAYQLIVSAEARKEIVKFCIRNAGKPYGVKQIIGIGWSKFRCALNKLINKVFKTKLNERVPNPFSDGKASQVCSEVIGYILRDQLGVKIQADLDVAGPRMLNEITRNIPNVNRIK